MPVEGVYRDDPLLPDLKEEPEKEVETGELADYQVGDSMVGLPAY